VVDKVALRQVLSEYFGFSCQSSFHQLHHNHPHPSSGAGTIGQKWPQYKGLTIKKFAELRESVEIAVEGLSEEMARKGTSLCR
jgi:hypothetical protein